MSLSPLSCRQWETLRFLAEGLTREQIAQQLGIAPTTVKNHVASIIDRLNANNSAHAVAIALRHHIIY